MNVATSASNGLEVSVEAGAGLERRMTVRLPSEAIEREIEARLTKLSRTAKLKGFRPGKIPRKVIQQRFGSQVRSEVVSDAIRTSFSRAVTEHKLNPAGGPRIEPLPEEGSSGRFGYRAVFEVYPEIKLKGLEELEVAIPKVSIEQADVDAMVEKLRAQRAEWRTVERKAENGDRVVIDYQGTIDKEPFQGGSGQQTPVVVGAGQVPEDFDKALKGLAAGDTKSIKVKFPKDYAAQNLAGKKAVFEVTVHRVEERVLPPLDEAFAAAFGVTEGGVPALLAEVRNNMQRELDERVRSVVKTRTFDALLKANDVPVPEALVEQEITALQADAMRQLGIEDPARAPAREGFRPLALRRVRIGLLIQELMREHKIKLDRARVDRRIEELAAPYENPQEAAQYYRSNRGLLAQVEAAVLEDQVVDFLLERAKTKDEVIGFQQFMGAQA